MFGVFLGYLIGRSGRRERWQDDIWDEYDPNANWCIEDFSIVFALVLVILVLLLSWLF